MTNNFSTLKKPFEVSILTESLLLELEKMITFITIWNMDPYLSTGLFLKLGISYRYFIQKKISAVPKTSKEELMLYLLRIPSAQFKDAEYFHKKWFLRFKKVLEDFFNLWSYGLKQKAWRAKVENFTYSDNLFSASNEWLINDFK